MKIVICQKMFFFLIPSVLSATLLNAQIASWSFDNTLSGMGSASSIAGNASLGSTIASGGAFNGGTVYYGEGNWPMGGIDLNAYLEFSITPSAGNTLTISSLAMQIRRSTTGSSGAGPNTWSLRSSLDAYATDIASGVLTANSSPATIATLGVAFMNLPSKITFRLYGYNATISSGGLNRFVYDNIVANGSTILPVVFDYFKVKSIGQTADISWQVGGEGNLLSLKIERASDGVNFQSIKQFNGDVLEHTTSFEYSDELNHPSGNYEYRIQLISTDGHISYSAIQTISFAIENSFQLQAINTGNGNIVSFRVNTEIAGNYIFSLYNLNGNRVAVKNAWMGIGSQAIQLDNRPLKSGIYILLGENGNQKTSTKIIVL
jgi:hypothetical protein